MNQTILVLNGPNLNLLGQREPELYGSLTLTEINHNLERIATLSPINLEFFQSNHEGELITKTHQLFQEHYAFAIVNPAGFSHTSIAWRDAILAVKKPFIELHLSNTHSRESFRNFSYFSDIAQGVIIGLGAKGYELALNYAIEYLLAKE